MEREYAGYLFVYFTGESENGEQVYFALSQDGLHWKDLNGGEPVLISEIGQMGVRDPFIFRSKLDGKFYILATDLRIAPGQGWETARASGSKKIILWSSDDLICWSAPWCYEVPLDGAGSVWAPETCYDERRQAYLVFGRPTPGNWGRKLQNSGYSLPIPGIFTSSRNRGFTWSGREVSLIRQLSGTEGPIIDLQRTKSPKESYWTAPMTLWGLSSRLPVEAWIR